MCRRKSYSGGAHGCCHQYTSLESQGAHVCPTLHLPLHIYSVQQNGARYELHICLFACLQVCARISMFVFVICLPPSPRCYQVLCPVLRGNRVKMPHDCCRNRIQQSMVDLRKSEHTIRISVRLSRGLLGPNLQ